MYRLKFVIVFLCLVNLAEPRTYYEIPDDPDAIVFPGPTNYNDRKTSDNEVGDDIIDLVNVRHGSFTVTDDVANPPPVAPPQTGGFVYPAD